MIPSLSNKTTISSRNKVVLQNGTHKVPAPTPTPTNSNKLNGIGSKTSTLFKAPSQIPRTRACQTPAPSRTSSTTSTATLRAPPATSLRPSNPSSSSINSAKSSATSNLLAHKKGLAKFSNPIECQRLFNGLNTKISELERSLETKDKDNHNLCNKFDHATKIGLGYATVVQYFAVKLKLHSEIDLLKECELISNELEELKEKEKYFDINLKGVVDRYEEQLQNEYDLRQTVENKLRDQCLSHEKEIKELKDSHDREVSALVESNAANESTLQKRIETLESELESKNADFANLKKDHESLIQRYDKLEESLTKDKDARVKYAQEKVSQLQKDVESLNTVLEMRTEKIHILEKDSLMLQELRKEFSTTKECNKTLNQQLESAKAALDKKREQIENITIELEDLKQKFNVEHKERRRMTMKTEELKYALNESISGDANQTLIPNGPSLEICLVEDETLDQIEEDLNHSKHAGLTVIDEDQESIVVICLTTEEKIYVFKPGAEKHVDFLKTKLAEGSATFYTVDGFYDAKLLDKLGISLYGHIDLIALDIQLSISDYSHREPGSNSQFSVDFIVDKIKPEILDYQQLLAKWLKANLNPKCSQSELCALKKLPFDSMAENAIRKRATLVRALGLRMIEEFYSIRDQTSKDIYSVALRADDETRENYERKGDNSFAELSNTLNRCPSLSQD